SEVDKIFIELEPLRNTTAVLPVFRDIHLAKEFLRQEELPLGLIGDYFDEEGDMVDLRAANGLGAQQPLPPSASPSPSPPPTTARPHPRSTATVVDLSSPEPSDTDVEMSDAPPSVPPSRPRWELPQPLDSLPTPSGAFSSSISPQWLPPSLHLLNPEASPPKRSRGRPRKSDRGPSPLGQPPTTSVRPLLPAESSPMWPAPAADFARRDGRPSSVISTGDTPTTSFADSHGRRRDSGASSAASTGNRPTQHASQSLPTIDPNLGGSSTNTNETPGTRPLSFAFSAPSTIYDPRPDFRAPTATMIPQAQNHPPPPNTGQSMNLDYKNVSQPHRGSSPSGSAQAELQAIREASAERKRRARAGTAPGGVEGSGIITDGCATGNTGSIGYAGNTGDGSNGVARRTKGGAGQKVLLGNEVVKKRNTQPAPKKKKVNE
ncbi:hypothetical protein LTS18_008372, partial [Coniosporium uncinatum]